jgi:flagellar FliL protein
MSDAPSADEDAPQKSSKLPLILGLVLALFGGIGGFYATWSGMILPSGDGVAQSEKGTAKAAGPDIAYVAVEPLVISIQGSSATRHLKFRAHLEVPAEAEIEVSKVLPRVVDVLNSYLRALEPSDLEDPSGLARLRSQMLRRVQVVTGAGKVNDLLIMEFVLT